MFAAAVCSIAVRESSSTSSADTAWPVESGARDLRKFSTVKIYPPIADKLARESRLVIPIKAVIRTGKRGRENPDSQNRPRVQSFKRGWRCTTGRGLNGSTRNMTGSHCQSYFGSTHSALDQSCIANPLKTIELSDDF